MKLAPYQEDLIKASGCKAEDVGIIEVIMRWKSPILGELKRSQYNKLARLSKEILDELRIGTDPAHKKLLADAIKDSKFFQRNK